MARPKRNYKKYDWKGKTMSYIKRLKKQLKVANQKLAIANKTVHDQMEHIKKQNKELAEKDLKINFNRMLSISNENSLKQLSIKIDKMQGVIEYLELKLKDKQ